MLQQEGEHGPQCLLQRKECRVFFQLFHVKAASLRDSRRGLGCHLMTRSSPGQQGLRDTKVSECAVRAARRELASSLLVLPGMVLMRLKTLGWEVSIYRIIGWKWAGKSSQPFSWPDRTVPGGPCAARCGRPHRERWHRPHWDSAWARAAHPVTHRGGGGGVPSVQFHIYKELKGQPPSLGCGSITRKTGDLLSWLLSLIGQGSLVQLLDFVFSNLFDKPGYVNFHVV